MSGGGPAGVAVDSMTGSRAANNFWVNRSRRPIAYPISSSPARQHLERTR